MGKKYIVSAFGKDRPGIVADVTQVLFEKGCNLEDTRMTNLSGEFSLMILFESPAEDEMETILSQDYNRLKTEKGISAYIRPVSGKIETPAEPLMTHTVKVEGLDQTGIVYKISRFLADRHINIANLDSAITHAPESGATLYNMNLQIEMPPDTSLDSIQEGLGSLADELHVDISVE